MPVTKGQLAYDSTDKRTQKSIEGAQSTEGWWEGGGELLFIGYRSFRFAG